ncbi:hypothetical protein KI387_044087 [Taxus chinensis]|uniref:Retrotransposon gag domain-containing protein n=1 Tax=Taxus chinensis TaxID=29808 RepID=A0AA38CNN9_TAXCH|nr:hypothetical protein KI387_044087 [Taxus chinensis]
MPKQHHDIQKMPSRQSIVTSPNEVISALVEKVRELELIQTGQNSQYMQAGSSKPPHHPSQLDLLTRVGTLGMTPQYSQKMPIRPTISNTVPPSLVQNNPFLDNTPSYLNMYSKSPQGDMFSSPGMFSQTQVFPYAPTNAYATPYQQPIPPPLPQQVPSMVETYAIGTYSEYLKEPLDFTIRSVMLPRPLPNLPKYKGEGDPNAHIKAYAIAIQELLPWDGVVAKIFPKTLEGIALDWYYRIPEASIHSFKHLMLEFIKAFDMNKLLRTGIREFLHIKQEHNESVTHFIQRWRTVIYSSASAPNMDQMELCDLFLHSLSREVKEEVQKFPLRTYDEVLESALQIDQAAIDSGHKTYGANGRLVTSNQNTTTYPTTTNVNQGPKILNKNQGVTTDGVTDQPKKVNVVNTPSQINNQRNNNFTPTINTVDFNHPQQQQQWKNPTQGPSQNSTRYQNQNSNQRQQTQNFNPNRQRFDQNFGPQYTPNQQTRNYNPNSYCGFHKIQGHDTRTCRDYNKFMQRLPDEQRQLFIDMFLADPTSPASNTFSRGCFPSKCTPSRSLMIRSPNHNNNRLNLTGTNKSIMTGNNDHEASTLLNPLVEPQLGS